jgi:hypothetical protein
VPSLQVTGPLVLCAGARAGAASSVATSAAALIEALSFLTQFIAVPLAKFRLF